MQLPYLIPLFISSGELVQIMMATANENLSAKFCNRVLKFFTKLFQLSKSKTYVKSYRCIRFLYMLKSHYVAIIPSGEEPKPQSAVSVWLFGPAGLCGALPFAVLVDTNDSHPTKGL